MPKLSLLAGTTSKTVKIFIQDNSVTTGAGLTGLAFNSGSLSAYYIKEGDASATLITLVTATLGTWTSSGFIVVDGTHMPGMYELGIPNAAIASGKSVVIYLFGATNMAPCVIEIELTAVDNQDAVKYGMTGVATPTNITAGTITTVTNLTNAPTAGDLTATMKTSVTTAATAATPNLAATGLDSVVMSDITAVPAMNASIKAAFNWVFALARNKRTETSTTETLFKTDGSTSVATSTKSDDGTVFTRGGYS